MIIAKSGMYSLRRKTYLGNHIYTTHDIELCRYNDNMRTVFTVATFKRDEDSYDIVSCGSRLIEYLNADDIEDVKILLDIATKIMMTEEVESEIK